MSNDKDFGVLLPYSAELFGLFHDMSMGNFAVIDMKFSFVSFSISHFYQLNNNNFVQYALIGIVPIIVLNKFIQKFIPEADTDKQSIELLMEIFLQIVVMFCGIVIIHRMSFIYFRFHL